MRRSAVTDAALSGLSYAPDADYPIQPIAFTSVSIDDTFWKPKIDANAAVTIPFEFQKAADDGSGGRGVSVNVLQAAIYSLQTRPDAALQARVDARIRELLAGGGRQRTGARNDLFEVAAAHFAATGKRDLLDPAIAAADSIYATVKRDNPPFSGGERDALNCVALYRATGQKRYLDLARHYLDVRGLESSVGRSRHNQSYKPVLEQSEAVGHAVNCASLMVSLIDVGVLTGLDEYVHAGMRMWADAVERKMYVTGGIGSSGNEGFGEPYSLPNISAYAETCAGLMFTTLNHKLFLATGDGKYIDVMERAMYNNAIDGVSASGNRFFYVNRLASAGDGRDLRWEKASLECCPPNLVRFLASMPGYIYAHDRRGQIYVNLYLSSGATFTVGGTPLSLSVDSEMPWGGRSTIRVSAREPVAATIKLRIPGWARNTPVPGGLYSYLNAAARPTSISVNRRALTQTSDASGYVSIERTWNDGDVIEIVLPLDVKKVAADARVKEDRGRIAVERGPIVYCAEWPDCEDANVLGVLIDPMRDLDVSFDKALCGGAIVLSGEAGNLARPAAPPRRVRLIPYHLWSNRGAGEMSVWLSTREFTVGDVGPAGGWIFYVNPNHAADGWRYLEAAPVDQSAGAKWGCFRTPLNGATGTAVGTGTQNTADILAGCATPGTAAELCAHYSLNGVRGWFLPSRDELLLMYRNLRATGAVDFGDAGVADNFTYWASSQQTTDMASHVDFADGGRLHSDDKDFPRRVRAIRTI
ncbi:MAG TPA: beta-L-arabinofuranosidase domain-containing protein [Vicinamibacterales bacterium]|nr:beta-L-arabinofuranosidase domain-containing protein [Vicinamibacterales bacterium]